MEENVHDLMFEDVFTEMAVILLISVFLGALGSRLKQPLIVTFIAVGILVGPSVLGWVELNDRIDLLAKMGIALLLFLVGLKLDIHVIKNMGPVALATGLGQVFFTSFFGFLLSILLGLSIIESLYVAVALTFSSTIIIVKLLSDKKELDQLHGRIAIGFLIVQDIVVVLAMIVLTSMGDAGSESSLWNMAFTTIVNGGILLLVVVVMMRFVLTPLLNQMAKSSEMLILFSISWAVSLAALGVHLGFSKEVGAFLAGVAVASTPYREIVASRLVSLRDFLLLFFFIDLGVGLELSTLTNQLVPGLILSLFVLIGNPLIVMFILSYMGYQKRVGFLAGLTVAQISEFSLILAALGASQGYINDEIVGMITLVGLITISVSTYMILYSQKLYAFLQPVLKGFKPRQKKTTIEDVQDHSAHYDLVIFGLGRIGEMMAEALSGQGMSVLAVDSNPEMVKCKERAPYKVLYGDMEAPEFLSHLPLQETRWVISSVRDVHTNIAMLYGLKEVGFAGKTAVYSQSEEEADLLRTKGVSHIVMFKESIIGSLLQDILETDRAQMGNTQVQ